MKPALRREIQARRDAIDPVRRSVNSKKIWERLAKLEVFKEAKDIACYVNFRSEVETLDFLIKHLDEKKFYIPRTKDKEMDFVLLRDLEELKRDSFGILSPQGNQVISPEDLDLILTPGIAFTLQGGRLGYGGGFYDRYFKKTHCPSLGLAFEEQILENLPLDSWDHLLNGIVTEERFILPKKEGLKFNTRRLG